MNNWILGFGHDVVIPTEAEWAPNPASFTFGAPVNELQSQEMPSMSSLRDGISDAMWGTRGTSRI